MYSFCNINWLYIKARYVIFIPYIVTHIESEIRVRALAKCTNTQSPTTIAALFNEWMNEWMNDWMNEWKDFDGALVKLLSDKIYMYGIA